MNTEALCQFQNDVRPGDDGWVMIAPYGDFPGMATITNPDGSLSRVPALQRLDKQSAETMVQNFKSARGLVKRYTTGAPIYLGHPDGKGIGHRYPDKTPKGIFTDLEARPNGFFGKPVFTNEGIELLNQYRALSGRWFAEEVGEEMRDGQCVKIFRPDVFKSAGLTNQPNLPVELLNEFEAGQQKDTNMNKAQWLALLASLGVAEINNDSSDEAISAAVEKRKGEIKATTELANEKTKLDGLLAAEKELVKTKDGTVTTLTQERDRLKTDFANERAARVTLMLDSALHDGRITPATKPEWKTRLEASFENESAALLKLTPVMKTAARTAGLGDRKAEIANAQERQAKVVELVNEVMEKNPRLSYDDAFAKIQREQPALFDQMKQPERLGAKS